MSAESCDLLHVRPRAACVAWRQNGGRRSGPRRRSCRLSRPRSGPTSGSRPSCGSSRPRRRSSMRAGRSSLSPRPSGHRASSFAISWLGNRWRVEAVGPHGGRRSDWADSLIGSGLAVLIALHRSDRRRRGRAETQATRRNFTHAGTAPNAAAHSLRRRVGDDRRRAVTLPADRAAEGRAGRPRGPT